MTDNKIIHSLECCVDQTKCDECSYEQGCWREMCNGEILTDALDLITRQKAEIERLEKLNAELVGLSEIRKRIALANLKEKTELRESLRTAKAEAIKEFAERLPERAHVKTPAQIHILLSEIDNLVKEMAGDPQ